LGFYTFAEMEKEVVTPRHSTAYGELLTGEEIEVGHLSYKGGEGAERHSHPQEQILVVLHGRVRVELEGETRVLTAGQAFHALPHVRHSLAALEDTEVLSCKRVVDGAGHRI